MSLWTLIPLAGLIVGFTATGEYTAVAILIGSLMIGSAIRGTKDWR